VAAAGAAEAGVMAALSVEAGVAAAGAGATDALSVEAGAEAGAGVVGGLPMAMVTGVVAHTVLCGPIAGAVFPTVATDTAATDTVRRS
jgi:hypothetical protein